MLEYAIIYKPIIPSCPKCKRGIPDGDGHTFCTAIGEWGDDDETEECGGWCKFFREKKHKKHKKRTKKGAKKPHTLFGENPKGEVQDHPNRDSKEIICTKLAKKQRSGTMRLFLACQVCSETSSGFLTSKKRAAAQAGRE